MSGRLVDRVCLVTGTTGIGAATARRLAAEGAAVFVVSRTPEHVEALVARVSETGDRSGVRVGGLAVDLATDDGAQRAVEACVARFGRIDGALSVAGGSGRRFGDGPIHELSPAAFDQTIELNLRTQALVSRAVVRQMLDQPRTSAGVRGSIVLVSSVLASRPVPELFGTHAYAAAKGAIVSLAIAMAATYAAEGIRVNVIAPGLVDTPMAERARSDPATALFTAHRQPLAGGLIEPTEIADAAVYLLADESHSVTGQVLGVDGGWSVVSAGPE